MTTSSPSSCERHWCAHAFLLPLHYDYSSYAPVQGNTWTTMENLVVVLVWITYHQGGQDGSLYKETGLLPVITNYVCVKLAFVVCTRNGWTHVGGFYMCLSMLAVVIDGSIRNKEYKLRTTHPRQSFLSLAGILAFKLVHWWCLAYWSYAVCLVCMVVYGGVWYTHGVHLLFIVVSTTTTRCPTKELRSHMETTTPWTTSLMSLREKLSSSLRIHPTLPYSCT